jgi:predicted nucleotidyltransferase
MDRKVLKLVKRFVRRVSRDFKLETAIFFGSRARGDYFLDSDVDVLLVSKDFENIPFLDRIRKMYEYWDYNYPLEVFCYTPSEFEKKKKQICLVSQALKEGVRVDDCFERRKTED